jgi:MFS superfamily sulfate permease-like transporter
MVLYRFEGPLFFANAGVFRDDVTAAVAAADPPARWVVLDMESVADTDSTATQTLVELLDDLGARGVTVVFARLKSPVAAYFGRAGIDAVTDPERVFMEVDDAVAAYRDIASAAPPIPSQGRDRT